MRRAARWQELDHILVGLTVLQSLISIERGEGGEIDIELEPDLMYPIDADQARDQTAGIEITPRWLRCCIDNNLKRVVIFEIPPPPELRRPGPAASNTGGNDAD